MSRNDVITTDRLIEHVSTAPAIAGQTVTLFLREKISASVLESTLGGCAPPECVLFVHGGYCPSTLAFDVPYRDYSWMAFLARAGFDVFAMDMTGYGRSVRPHMDNPRNLEPACQQRMVPAMLPQICEPDYPFVLVNSDSETADIARAVDYICALRGVDKVSLIGWSGGGIRTGTFASRHPEKVDKLILHASSNYDRVNPDNPPGPLPQPGAPMTIQMRDVGIDQRWLGAVADPSTIEPGMPDYIWTLNVEHDPLGATWGAGGLRAPTRTYWGWNANGAGRISAPTLMMTGEQDRLLASNLHLMDDLGASTKAFITMECATHFAVWESQRRVLHDASLQWLTGLRIGDGGASFRAGRDGVIRPV
ncbi:MAG: alpha/beta fold hydrolase [Hyphomicrobiales bacterium]|nr:alpha/beta fold hydrolase [Hyphomicrobiales bacterium]